MPQLGLLGYPLSHSFSKGYFADKFSEAGLDKWSYENFAMESLEDFPALLKSHKSLHGLNVTIPHKEAVIPFLDELSKEAEKIRAVNTITIAKDGSTKGYNTDVFGFRHSLEPLLPAHCKHLHALVLGTGGASKGITYVLGKLGIPFKMVSRTPKHGQLSYQDISSSILEQHRLIVNTTPLGMYPKVEGKPPLPYAALNSEHILYDLVYNPATTAFLQEGIVHSCTIENGLKMLELQAEKSWEIWQEHLST